MVDENFAQVFDREFEIQPEYLDTEEIRYELKIRDSFISGDRRTLTSTLRTKLAEERRNPGAYEIRSIGLPSQEYEYCDRNTERLRSLSSQVTIDPISHDRFMSVYLHLEGRLNRIPRVSNALDLTNVIFRLNEEYANIYHEFVERVRVLKEQRQRGAVNRLQAVGVQPTNHSMPSISSVINNEQTVNDNTNRNQNEFPNHDFQIYSSQQLTDAAIVPNNNNNDPSLIPNADHRDNLNDSMLEMMQVLRNGLTFPAVSNATMMSNDNARLSQHFQSIQRPLFTPIVSTGQQLPVYTVANANSAVSRQTYQTNANLGPFNIPPPNYMNSQVNQLPSYHVSNTNDGQLQIVAPPTNYGENRQNSLPRGFGPSPRPINSAMQNQIGHNDIPIQTNNSNNTSQMRANMNNQGVNQLLTNVANNGNAQAQPLVTLGNSTNGSTNAGVGVIGQTQNVQNGISANPNTNNNLMTEQLNQMMALLNNLSVQVHSLRQTGNSAEHIPVNTNALVNTGTTYTVHSNQMQQQMPSAICNHPIMVQQSVPTSQVYQGANQLPDQGPNIFGNQPNSITQPNPFAQNNPNVQQGSERFNNHHFVPIHKWNWKFCADKSSDIPEKRDLAAFLKKLELYRQAENLTYEHIHQKFHFLIGGGVYEWYMQYRQNFTNWSQLLEGLKKQFTTPLTHFMKVAKLATRRQKKGESVMEYIASIQREFDELNMYDETEKISIIQNGLSERLRDVAMATKWERVQDMELHLRSTEVADELRKETESQTYKRPYFPRRAINVIDTQENLIDLVGERENEDRVNDEFQVNIDCQAIKTKSQVRKPTCYNCKSEQHRLIDCDEPITRIFCFRCGKEGVRAPNCTCMPKNSKNVACSTAEACDQQMQSQME